VTEAEAQETRTRTVRFDGLNILDKQNVWGGARITRNERLFGGSPETNPRFVLHTPVVRFPEILTPLLEYDQAIDLARLPASPGGALVEASKKPINDHLVRLFKRMFEGTSPVPAEIANKAAFRLPATTNTIWTTRRSRSLP
jgi:hypothetical protein